MKKIIVALSSLILIFSMSLNVFAQSSQNESYDQNVLTDSIDFVDSSDINSIAKFMGIDTEDIVDVDVYMNSEMPSSSDDSYLSKPEISSYAWYDTWVKVRRTSFYSGGAWGSNPISKYYLSQYGSMSRTESKSVSKTASFTSGISVSGISAQLGLGSSTTNSVSQTVGYSNSNKYAVNVNVYVIYDVYGYGLYGNSSGDYYGSGRFLNPVGFAVVATKA